MKRYDKLIINALLDKYENSKLRTGLNKVNINIKVNIQDVISNYYQPDIFSDEYDDVHQQLKTLENRLIITIKWKKNKIDNVIESVYLNVNNLENAYKLVNRVDLTEKEQRLLEICNSNKGISNITDIFINHLISLLNEHKSVKKYVDIDDLDKFTKELRLLEEITSNKEELYVRELSIRFFNDSKTAEPLLNKVCSLIREFSTNDLSSLTNEELLQEFNIYHNPSWIMIKGKNYFHYPKIDLEYLTNGISFSSKDINLLKWDSEKKPKMILTVENLTSFSRIDFQNKDVIILYLGGFSNHIKCEFLKNLYSYYPNSHYYHFGDTDCGGFKIWKNLVERTFIPFKTVAMDLKTLINHDQFCKELTTNDFINLKQMKDDPFFTDQIELFNHMLSNNIKLEQECIKLNFDSLI